MKTLIGVTLVVIGLVVWASVREAQQWERFAMENECKKFGEVSSSIAVGPTVGGNGGGVSTLFIPGKTGYRCKDGSEYWR